MTTLTITRTEILEETAGIVRRARLAAVYGTDQKSGRPRTHIGVYHGDGSGRATDGILRLLDWAAADLGKRRVRSAIIDAVKTGTAEVTLG